MDFAAAAADCCTGAMALATACPTVAGLAGCPDFTAMSFGPRLVFLGDLSLLRAGDCVTEGARRRLLERARRALGALLRFDRLRLDLLCLDLLRRDLLRRDLLCLRRRPGLRLRLLEELHLPSRSTR